MFRIFSVHADVDACNCMQGLYEHCKRVCTESWLEEKSLVSPGTWTYISIALVPICTHTHTCLWVHACSMHTHVHKEMMVVMSMTGIYIAHCVCECTLVWNLTHYNNDIMIKKGKGTKCICKKWKIKRLRTKKKITHSHTAVNASSHSSAKTSGINY